MITTGNNVACLSKAGRCQVFLDGKMRELYHFSRRILIIDNDKQIGASRQHRVYWIFQAAVFIKIRNRSCFKIKCEQLGKLLDKKGTGGHCNELKQPIGEFPVCVIDISQRALIRLIQRLWQVGQCILDLCWDAAAQVVRLTLYPSEPTSQNEQVVKNLFWMPYIPSAFSPRTSMTSCLCFAFHPLFFGCVLMTNFI